MAVLAAHWNRALQHTDAWVSLPLMELFQGLAWEVGFLKTCIGDSNAQRL